MKRTKPYIGLKEMSDAPRDGSPIIILRVKEEYVTVLSAHWDNTNKHYPWVTPDNAYPDDYYMKGWK